MKIALVAILIVLVLGTTFALQRSNFLFSPRANSDDIQNVTLGPEQHVYESKDSGLPDLPYFTMIQNGKPAGVLTTWTGNFSINSPLSEKISSPQSIPGLKGGASTSDFDHNGLWLVGAYKDPNSNIIHGVYHAENYQNTEGAEDRTKYSVGYVKSTDEGKTWQKPANNQILTGYNPPNKVGGADPGSLILRQDNGVWYLYLYYFEHTNVSRTRGITVARAPISESNNPASWKKYYCSTSTSCGFTQPGLGGNFTKVKGLDGQTSVTYNDYLKKYLAISSGSITTNNIAQFKVSEDGLRFTNFAKPLPLGEPYPNKDWIRVYVSQVADDALPGHTGQNFYLYYVTLTMNKETGFPNVPRYTFRRSVSLFDSKAGSLSPIPTVISSPIQAFTPTPTPIISPTPTPVTQGGLLSLQRKYNSDILAHIYDVPNAPKNNDINQAVKEGICCRIWANQVANSVPLYRVNTNTDYFLEASENQIAIAESRGYGNKVVLGYCYNRNNHPAGTVPLYRFNNDSSTDHLYTISDQEKTAVLKLPGWVYEGVVCYVQPN